MTRSLEELVSQTSSPESGTHLSNVSGFSLGEAIVQRAKQGNESGPQLQATTDIGGMTSASVSRLPLADAERQPKFEEFPTMEEGMISVTEESMSTQGVFGEHRPRQMLELQGSGLSPALPLLASYSMQNQEEELSSMFFHRSPMEFAPLRGTPDLSGVSCEGYARAFQQAVISEASSNCVRGSLSLSQHPLGDINSTCSLSQHSLTPPSPRWSQATEDEDFARAEKFIRDQRFMELPSVSPCVRSDGSHPQTGGVPFPGQALPLGRELSSPRLLEEEIGLPSSPGLTSSSGSVTETNRPLGDNQRSSLLGAGGAGGIADPGKQWEPSASGKPAASPRRAPVSPQSSDPELVVPHEQPALSDPGITFPEPLGVGSMSLLDPARPEFSDAVVQLQEQQASATRQTSHSKVSLECQRPSSRSLSATSKNGVSSGANIESASSFCGKDDTIIEVLPIRSGDRKGNGMGLSGCSTEQEQKDSELSPTVCPPSFTDSSLLTSLASPVCQSTPAVALSVPPAKGPAQLGQGRRVANRLIESQAPLAGTSKFSLAPSFGKQGLSSTSQNATASNSQASPGTLQSMPPLSYMEKVGAWDLHHGPGNKPSFDSLVLHGLRGVSPRQRAHSAIADSLNHILSRISETPTSSSLPRRSIAATSGTAGRPADHQQSAQGDGQLSDAATRDAPRSGSQPDARRGSLHDASLYKPDSPRSCLNQDRGRGIRSPESASALGKCLSSWHSGAGRLMQEDPPAPDPTDRRENIDSEQIARGSEPHAILPGPCPTSTTVHPDRFYVASPVDELNPPGSSQDTSRVGEQTLTVSGHSLTSLEVDNYVPIWTPSRLTPDPNHFNVEDRIPIYLRNLGINQSPRSILGSKGPSGQLDFTPMELKRLGDTVARTSPGFQGAEELSSLDHVSRCSFSSDTLTHSTSIPSGCDRGQDALIHSQLAAGMATVPAVSQCGTAYPSATRQLDFSDQLPAHRQPAPKDSPEGGEKPVLPLLNVASGLNSKSLSRTVGQSLHGLGSAADVVVHEPMPLCSSPGSKRMPAAPPAAGLQLTGEGVEAFSPGTQSCGRSHLHRDDCPWHEDELIGLKTLSEIRKLLGETGTPLTNRQGSVATDFIPEKLGPSKDEAVTPANVEEFLSRWTVTSPQSNSLFGEGPGTGEDLGHRTPPTIGNTSCIARSLPGEGERQWQEPLERQASTASGERATQTAFVARVDRAEPEGCSGATAGRPATAEPAEFSRTTSKTVKLTASKPLATPSVPQFASQPVRAHALSVNNSSRDGGLDEDSSTDSLAARVSNLLRDQSTATRESISTWAADKVKHRTHDEEQIKLLMQPPDPLTILDEEDRRKIEEIKAELLQTSKNFIHPQDDCSLNAEDISLPSDLASSVDTASEIELPTIPSAALQSVNAARSQLSNQLQKLPDDPFDTAVQLRTPLRGDMGEQLKAMDRDSPVSDCIQYPPSQPVKPVVAITFSSRRKPPSPGPQVSAPLPEGISGGQRGASEDSPTSARAVRDELAQPPSPTFRETRQRRPQSGPEQREQLAGGSSVPRQALADTGEPPCPGTPTEQKPHSSPPDPRGSSSSRTVLSRIRVTLSPMRPAGPGALPNNTPTSSGGPLLGAEERHRSGEGPQPAPPPTHHDSLDMPCPVACQPAGRGPPYPPLPMPIPAFYPTFLPLFDYPSEVKLEPRIPTAQDGSKVDVSTQTIIPPSSDSPVATAVTVEQEVLAQTRRTQPDVALRTTVNSTATSSHTQGTQGTDVPVMLPYKPAGSSKLFYMPKSGTRNRIGQLDPESSSESLRADSQEAPPAGIPAEALGARGHVPSSTQTKHRGRAKHSRAAASKKPREKEDMRLFESGIRCHQSSLTPGAGTFPEKMPLRDVSDSDFSTSDPVQRNIRSPSDSQDRRPPLYPKARQRAGEREPSSRGSQSYPTTRQASSARVGCRNAAWPHTTGEAQRYWEEEEEGGHHALSYLEWTKAAAGKPRHGRSGGQPTPISRYTELAVSAVSPTEQSSGLPRAGGTERYSSLDELWQRFKERQKKHKRLGSSSASELSLLERLDELARLLRNPVHHPLLSAEGRDRQHRAAQRERRRRAWEDPALARPSSPPPGSLATTKSESADSLEEISTERIKKILDHQRYAGTQNSSSAGPPTTESDTTTLAETDAQTQTETGSTISTIDTERLVRAFGPERVTVQPLSRLYGTIEKQKESSVHRRERPRRAETRCPSAASDQQISGAQSFTVPITTSDSASTQSPSVRPPHGPSSKLINKRCTRLVNQGVQTESLPIVTSAKGRRTRDVGVTFPSPDSEPTLHLPAVLGSHRQHSASPAGCSSARAKDRKRKGSSHTERAPGKDGRTSAGPAWFIPATELKWALRKENDPGTCRSHTSGNFELLPSTTLCREPLREKQLQQQWISNSARAWGQEPAQGDALLKNPSPLIRITLKEALHMNRPDFISHSRQRVKRLELLMEERKIQSILQSERERLFNQPQERGPRDRNGHQLAEAILFKRRIPKREMFDRSKRLYEQLPEVTRKRDEDRRRAEYQTNRLKAQLYKQKITSRVLGKKVSWQ
ncbi:uncharacterized protein LOC121279071 isoform X2 [Carcharodon carcharias]|nr:uncharacterized protein LOC121279071 isoform X2 [Carcharodon carcharias]